MGLDKSIEINGMLIGSRNPIVDLNHQTASEVWRQLEGLADSEDTFKGFWFDPQNRLWKPYSHKRDHLFLNLNSSETRVTKEKLHLSFRGYSVRGGPMEREHTLDLRYGLTPIVRFLDPSSSSKHFDGFYVSQAKSRFTSPYANREERAYIVTTALS